MCLVLSTLCVAGLLPSLPALGLDWFNQVPPSELATLIGGNGGKQQGVFFCSDLNDFSCDQVGTENCKYCSSPYYSDVGTASGKYMPTKTEARDCGQVRTGDCIKTPTRFFCEDNPNTKATGLDCKDAPAKPVAQDDPTPP
jgi:hypothetical protein